MGRSSQSFQERLCDSVSDKQSQLVLGLDPSPEDVINVGIDLGSSRATAADALFKYCSRLVEAVVESCVCVKPQLARFELLGAPGWEALERVIEFAQGRGLLVIADGKRGDVPHTASVYAEALFRSQKSGLELGLGAEAATVNPLCGLDCLQSFLQVASSSHGAVFVLVRTSNSGAARLQGLTVGGHSLSEEIAQMVTDVGEDTVDATGLSNVAAVVGATDATPLARLRKLMPNTIFLVPGLGAQGGEIRALEPALTGNPAAVLITAARSIAQAHVKIGGEPFVEAGKEAKRLALEAWQLGGS